MPRLLSIMFNESGTFQKQFNRPFSLNMNGDRIKPLIDLTQHGEKLQASTIRRLGNEMIGVSPLAGPTLAIANGWDERRCTFVMCVEMDPTVHTAIAPDRVYFVGWTDHTGIVQRNNYGFVNPQMRMYFNSSVRCRVVGRNTMNGQLVWRPVDNIQLLTGSFEMGFVKPNPNGVVTPPSTATSMRPSDVFTQMGLTYSDAVTINAASRFADSVKANSRMNDLPDHYMSTIFTKMAAAMATHRDSSADYVDAEDVMDTAAQSVSESPLYDRALFNEMDQNFAFNKRGYITFGDLAELFPGISDPKDPRVRTRINNRAAAQRTDFRSKASVGGSSAETVMALNLGNAVPALISAFGIQRISFSATNNQIGGGFHVDFVPPTAAMGAAPEALRQASYVNSIIASFVDGLDVASLIETIKHELITTVLTPLDVHHNFTINLTVMCEIFNYTIIHISLNGMETQEYVLPTFADGLTSPCFDATGRGLVDMAVNVDSIREHLGRSQLEYRDPDDLRAIQSMQVNQTPGQLFQQPSSGPAVTHPNAGGRPPLFNQQGPAQVTAPTNTKPKPLF